MTEKKKWGWLAHEKVCSARKGHCAIPGCKNSANPRKQ